MAQMRTGQTHCPAGVTEMNPGIIGMGDSDVKQDRVSIRPAPAGFGITNVRDVAAGAWQADVYFALMDSNHNFVHYVYYPLGRLHVGNPNDLYPPLSTHLSLTPNTRYYAKIFLRDIRGASVTEATYGIRCFRTRP